MSTTTSSASATLAGVRDELRALQVAADTFAGTDPFSPWVHVALHLDLAGGHLTTALSHANLGTATTTASSYAASAGRVEVLLNHALSVIADVARDGVVDDDPADVHDVHVRGALRAAQLALREALDACASVGTTSQRETVELTDESSRRP